MNNANSYTIITAHKIRKQYFVQAQNDLNSLTYYFDYHNILIYEKDNNSITSLHFC